MSSNLAPSWWCRLFGHHWVSMKKEVIESGEWCPRCGKVRP